MTVLMTHLDGLVPGIALGIALFTVIALFLRLVRTRGEADLRRDVLENVHDAVYVIRLSDGKFILLNRRFEELFGVSAEEARSGAITPLDLVAPEDRDRIAERMARRRSGEDQPHLYEFRAVTRSGETRHVEVDTVPVMRRGERLVFGICRDVTEKRRALEAVREEHERLLTIFDGIDEVIYVADMETYEVLYANRRARDLAGEDPVGKPCCVTIHRQDTVAPCSSCPNESLLGDGEATGPFVWEFTSNKDGRTYRCMDRAIRWPDGRTVRFELAVDITEQKQLEERVRQDQKLEALGTLVEGISHDFNNLLSAIVGYASLALSRLEPGGPGTREVERIAESARRAAGLVERLIAFGMRDIEESALFDLNDVVREAISTLSGEFDLSIRLRADLHPEPLMVRGQPQRLHHAVAHVLRNACESMPAGGDVVARTGVLGGPDDDLSAARYGITITDQGVGIPEDVLPRIYEPFFTTKERCSGLGLSVAYSALTSVGGLLDAESEPGKGTRVVIGLPAAGVLAEAEEDLIAPVRGEKGTILVVDDEEVIRDLAQEILADAGHRVVVVAGGREALDILCSGSSDVELAIMDLAMPGMTGQETVRTLRERGVRVPVLISSGFVGGPPGEMLASLDAQGFVPKPYEIADLVGAVERILSGRAAAPTSSP